MATTYSIGIMREDDEFQILMTINNNEGLISNPNLEILADAMVDRLIALTGEKVIKLERQDVEDSVYVESN